MEQIYTPTQDYKVLVRCSTYNQSKYIEDALNGFAMQKTNFPFACLVMDDCSTDGEQEVIKAWMKRECDMTKAEYVDLELSSVILVPHNTNGNCTFAIYLLKQNLYGTGKKSPLIMPWRECCSYESICEGDDYWIAENKLQRQADILDSDPNISMAHTGFITVDENKKEFLWKKYSRFQNISKSEKGFVSLFDKNHIMTLTVMFRQSLIKSNLYANVPISLDYAYFMTAAFLGRIAFIPEKMGAYRKTRTGAMETKRAHVNKSIYQNFRYFVNYYLDNEITLSFFENIQTYFYILTNVLFNDDKELLLKVIKSRKASVLVLPFSYAYSIAKKIKNR